MKGRPEIAADGSGAPLQTLWMLSYPCCDSIRQLSDRLASAVTRALMPRRCVFCDVISRPSERSVCRACFEDLPWIRYSCLRCGVQLPSKLPPGVWCAACQTNPPPFTATVAPLEYAFPVDAAIKALKFQRRLFFVPAFAEIMLAVLDTLPNDIDSLLPVPLHRWRHMRRGFNQATEIAKPVSAALGLPLVTNVYRNIATPYQSGLNAHERRTNLKAAFRVDGRLTDRHVLIVDDVITTGETGRQIARLALASGADKVSVLAIARA